ncbi:MAG: (d)CMP kinase [Actinomycetaceae bacterium]|nr:(d)CMP kinase [Actinomycetaceae bacterium]
MNGIVIAIDGPSGSGKSTVSRAVAQQLKLQYLDTGAMYRAFAWWVLDQGQDPENAEKVGELADHFPLRMVCDPKAPAVVVNNQDITQAIRQPEVTMAASTVSAYPKVRHTLIALQRKYIEVGKKNRGIVAEGRDITSVVAPQAPVRILLTASAAARLARRSKQTGERDQAVLKRTVVTRDQQDARTTSFMEPGEGVHLLDSTALTLEAVIAKVISWVEEETQQ